MRPAARPPRTVRWCTLVIAGALAGTAACGGEGSTGPKVPPTPTVVELWLESGRDAPVRLTADTLERGDSRYVTAHARLSDGQKVKIDTADWSVSDTAVLAPLPLRNGERADVLTRGEGSAAVTARVGALRAEVRYVVQRPVARAVTLPDGLAPLPGLDSLVIDLPKQYHAAVASRSIYLTDRPVTWTSSDTAVATVAPDGTLTSRALGSTTITASAEGLSASQLLVIRPPRAARLAITYAPDSLMRRRTDSVRAVLYDSSGAPIAVRPRLTVAGGLLVRDSLLEGTYAGTAEVVASGDGLEARRTVRILPVPPGPAGVYPAATAAVVGGAPVFLATRPQDADGYLSSDAPVPVPTFTSDDPAVATVSERGLVAARAPGATVVRVRHGATETAVPVTAVEPGAFAVEFRAAGAASDL